MKSKIKINYKIWLETDGRAFGYGPFILLTEIDRLGSINKAAEKMKISYKRALALIHLSEERLGIPLIERHIGGKSGGYSKLTAEGRDFLNFYTKLSESVGDEIERVFNSVYNEFTRKKTNQSE